jgi:t-SNARE complex subunit (syntaxin)
VDEAYIEADIVKQRQEDLNLIEKMMNEVNLMTKDMAVEVEMADGKLEAIGSNARATKENAKKAAVDVAKGAEYQKKCMYFANFLIMIYSCCIVWIIILVLAAVGITLWATVFK